MKKLVNSAFFILFLSLVVSCSSDDSSDAVNPPANSFSFTLDGEEKTLTEFSAEKFNHIIKVYGETADGYYVDLTFNEQGHLGNVTLSREEPLFFRISLDYHTDVTFDFNLVNFSEANHSVSANFSGKVYNFMGDESEFSEVEGSFDLAYVDVAPETPELWLTASFNGQDWIDTGHNSISTIGGQHNNYKNGSEYSISVHANSDVEVGTYDFTETSIGKKVVVYKYNPELGEEESFLGTGELVITEKEEGDFYTLFKGTFNVTAEHPETGEIVTITNGNFKAAAFN